MSLPDMFLWLLIPGLFGQLPMVTAVSGYVKNHCNFPTYVQSAKCQGADTDVSKINPYGDYWAPWNWPDSIGNECSMTIKLGRDPSMRDIYQIEYSVKNSDNRIWYDVSPVDGRPFTAYARFMQVGSDKNTCPYMWCPPGSTTCEWPATQNCAPPRDVSFYLC